MENIAQIQDDAQRAEFFNNSIVLPGQMFTYDALYRLIEGTGREQIGTASFGTGDNNDDASWMGISHKGDDNNTQNYTQNYTYDVVGNILELQHSATVGAYTRTYNYDTDSNKLESTQIGGGTPYAYTYDDRGNMLTMPHLSVMDWNAQNELCKTARLVGLSTVNTYFNYSGGQRIRKVCDKGAGLVEVRIYLGSFELFRKYVSGTKTLERTTVHVSDDTGRIAMLEHRTVGSDSAPTTLQRYVYSNHLSTASLELDENADIISYEEYHPYGTTSYQAMNASINAVAKRYRYTGKERDEETGLYYHGARYYIPWLCRWSAVDPLESKFAGMSPYNYGFNNPIIWQDSTGMHPDPPKDGDKTAEQKAAEAAAAAAQSQAKPAETKPNTVDHTAVNKVIVVDSIATTKTAQDGIFLGKRPINGKPSPVMSQGREKSPGEIEMGKQIAFQEEMKQLRAQSAELHPYENQLASSMAAGTKITPYIVAPELMAAIHTGMAINDFSQGNLNSGMLNTLAAAGGFYGSSAIAEMTAARDLSRGFVATEVRPITTMEPSMSGIATAENSVSLSRAISPGYSSEIDAVLNQFNKIVEQGGTVKFNKLEAGQEINMTIELGGEKINFRVETHVLPVKYGGDAVTPVRHMNVDLFPKSNLLPNAGHKILTQ